MEKKKKSGGGILFPLGLSLIFGQVVLAEDGYQQLCVAQSEDKVHCVPTSSIERYLSSAGVEGLQLPDDAGDVPDGQPPALLMCQGGDYYPIGLDPREVDHNEGNDYLVGDMPSRCRPPKKEKGLKRYYGPAEGKGSEFCKGRTSPDNCKDCCLGVALAQTGMVAAAGKLYRGTKPDPRGILMDIGIETISYGLIYLNRYNCDDNCEIAYDIEERVRQ